MHLNIPLATVSIAALASAATVPDNVKKFLDSVRSQGECTNKLQTGLTLSDSESDTDNTYSYCGDRQGVIYLQGTGGKLADMDVDCDGATVPIDGDTRCNASQDTIPETTFKDNVKQFGIDDLNAYIHSYVVFGNTGSKEGFVNFNPQEFGMEPLSVMAVVCGDQMFYGVWGDTNGDDQPRAAIGEASLSLATLCFGNGINGNAGHGEPDVLYIGFTGRDSVADASVNWKAGSAQEFQDSLATFGDRLIKNL
ncbi:fungal chitosanase [Pochonia chlamydosporia 170]|uniref:Endo-chitosanase n=1 Tax=Pochonia chlamydosporia 170 TaxID=1380566 RepID=A0A179F1U1_METCM|nr:fungal chitosanase [Pochonia chlamydosporia 170]OAQ59425.1 fungal chitosanase [Pochonia chlamydosporia 170]